MIPQTPPIVSSLPDRKLKCGMFKSRTSKTNRAISEENKLMFGIGDRIKSLELCNTEDIPIIDVESLDDVKGYGKG